ncbi:MAG: hypothetical protein IT580_01945 [Verrucomicrobiales bacterium]|nr:hypothetical protein [Verrucomicrobiales bacterium]
MDCLATKSESWPPASRLRASARLLALAWVLGVTLGGLPAFSAPVVTRELLALEGQPAPGGAANETFGSLRQTRPRINRFGDVAFIAPVLGVRADGAPVSVVFLKTSRGLLRLAQEDTSAPGLAGPLFGRLSHLALNDAGSVAFVSRREVTEALFSNASGTWHVVADTLGPQPSGLRFYSFSTVATDYGYPLLLRSSATAEVLFPAEVVSGDRHQQNSGLWIADPDGWDPRALFVPEQSAPGLDGLPLLQSLSHWGLGSDPARRSIFAGILQPYGSPPALTNLQTLWVGTGRSALSVLARSGDRAPVPEPDVFYHEFTHASVNGTGNVAFAASLVSPHHDESRALFTGPPDAIRPAVRTGDAVRHRDGSPLGQVGFVGQPVLNAPGQILCNAGIPDRSALLRWSPEGRLEALAVQGDAWPEAPPGWTFGPPRNWNFNAEGRAAFVADLVIQDQTEQAWGLWITDATGAPVLVAITSMNPSAITPPPGVPVFSDGFPTAEIEGLAGGTDGLPRFLSDTHAVVHVGQRPDGLTELQVTQVDPSPAPPRDESFRFTRVTPFALAPLEASDSAAPTLAAPSLLFAQDGLLARADKDWTGARLRLEIIENLAADTDLLGLDPLGRERQRIAPGSVPTEIQFLDQTFGILSRPQPGALEITFNAQATTEHLGGLLRTLAFGSSQSLATSLRREARHTEPRRRLMLRLTDAGGRVAEATQSVDFPRTVGLAFEGHGLDHRLWADGNRESSTITLRLQLLLSDGTRLPLGCAPTAADVQWIPNSAAQNFTLESAGGIPCATASMTYFNLGGFPSVVRLHGWEALHLLRREQGLTDIFTQGINFCMITFFNHWIASQFDGANPARHAPPRPLPNSPAAAASSADLAAGPYSLRAWMQQSSEGRRLAQLYDQHSPEVVARLLADFGLLTDTLTLVREFLPGLREFLAGQGSTKIIREDMVTQVNRVWDRLAADGSPALRQAIEQERTRFHGLQDFVGRTFAEWGTLLGFGSPETPFITASSPRLEHAVFHVEANRVSGLAYSLWRRDTTPDARSEAVPNGTLGTNDTTVLLTDPTPPSTPRWYQIRTQAAPGDAPGTGLLRR